MDTKSENITSSASTSTSTSASSSQNIFGCASNQSTCIQHDIPSVDYKQLMLKSALNQLKNELKKSKICGFPVPELDESNPLILCEQLRKLSGELRATGNIGHQVTALYCDRYVYRWELGLMMNEF